MTMITNSSSVPLAICQWRQDLLCGALLNFHPIGFKKALEQEFTAAGPEHIRQGHSIARCCHVHGGDMVDRRLHLRGDKAPPDQLIQPGLVWGKMGIL
jgi:hypothetical protein